MVQSGSARNSNQSLNSARAVPQTAHPFSFIPEHSMETKLQRIHERLCDLRDEAHDDELSDELDSALLHLDAAIDRLTQLSEEEDDDDDAD